MAINFVLFGSLKGVLKTIIADKKFIDKSHKGNIFNPSIVFDLSRALYGLASDIEGGKLKNLDMKYYYCITKVIEEENIIVLGIEKGKKMDDQIEEISPFIKIIAEILIDMKEGDDDKLPLLLKNVPILGKEIKKMTFQCC